MVLLAVLAVPLVAFAGDDGPPAGFEEFATQFRTAHDASSIEQFARLVYWERVDAQTRGSVERQSAKEFGRAIMSISFEPLPGGATLEYERAGVTYRPNLPPLGQLVVLYAPRSERPTVATSTRYLLGRESGKLRIATAAPVPDP